MASSSIVPYLVEGGSDDEISGDDGTSSGEQGESGKREAIDLYSSEDDFQVGSEEALEAPCGQAESDSQGPQDSDGKNPDHLISEARDMSLGLKFEDASEPMEEDQAIFPEIRPGAVTTAPPLATNQPALESPEVEPSEEKRSAKTYALREKDLPEDLSTFLREVSAFFTKAVNLGRQRPPLAESTFRKAQERMLCYLGFLRGKLGVELQPDVFARVVLIEKYLDYLREERKCGPATVSNHVSSLLYPIKFLYREQAPKYDQVPIISQLRTQATILQREGDVERPSSREELMAANKWLDWEQIVDACRTQRDYFEMAVNKAEKARECCDLVMLALYVYIPPSRGLEIRTMEIVRNWKDFHARDYKGRNVLVIKDIPEVSLHFDDHKTQKYTGHDELTLEADHELCRIIRTYVDNHRPLLLGKKSGDTLLLNRYGERFSSSAFSTHFKNLFYKLTGTMVSVNMLRSAFVTWAYGQSNCTDSLKESLAAALRHSRNQAERTYDRRMATQKKGQAVSLARDFAQESMDNPPEASPSTSRATRDGDHLKLGQFVGLVEEGSSLDTPKVLVGQIHALLPDGNVSLLWYKNAGGSLYKLELDGQWVESATCLVPVSMTAAKGKAGVYRLGTSPRTIHKAVMDE